MAQESQGFQILLGSLVHPQDHEHLWGQLHPTKRQGRYHEETKENMAEASTVMRETFFLLQTVKPD